MQIHVDNYLPKPLLGCVFSRRHNKGISNKSNQLSRIQVVNYLNGVNEVQIVWRSDLSRKNEYNQCDHRSIIFHCYWLHFNPCVRLRFANRTYGSEFAKSRHDQVIRRNMLRYCALRALKINYVEIDRLVEQHD